MRKGSFKIWVLLLTILTLSVPFRFVYSQPWNPPTTWPAVSDYTILDRDTNENGAEDDWRDIEWIGYTSDESYLYLKMHCYGEPGSKWSTNGSRYKWFIDLTPGSDLYWSGGNVIGAEYLLFVEDTDGDGTGEMYLLPDTDEDGRFDEYEPWPPTPIPGLITEAPMGGFQITDNQIEMYISWTSLGFPEPPTPVYSEDFFLSWATDPANPNLLSGPNTDRVDEVLDLMIVKTVDPSTAFDCDNVTYTYTVTNLDKTYSASNVVVTDNVIGKFDYPGELGPGETWTFTQNYTIPLGPERERVNEAIVSSTALETNFDNNKDTATVTLPTWESYEDTDHTNVRNYFDENWQTVYMMSSELEAGVYGVTYYDGAGIPVYTYTIHGLSAGPLSHEYYFPDNPSAAPGMWEAHLYKLDNPACAIIDTFEVNAGAIPEFPMVIATIGVTLLCASVYIYMRKRYIPATGKGVIR